MNMNIKRHGLRLLATLVFAALSASPLTYAAEGDVVEPLMIQEQGSFAVGGTVIQSPGTFDTANPASGGQTLHGDHARVFYQVPVNARKLPLVMWHGFGQFSKTWETTADGREGYQTLFLRRQFTTYLIDQPRRGAAGRGTVGGTVSATPDEQRWFNTFRVGVWPDHFRRAVLVLQGGARSILPFDDAGYRSYRRQSGQRCSFRPVRQDRPRNSRHSLAQRRHGLASGDEESSCPGDCVVRTG